MEIKVNKSTFFVFDLDDTLYQEIDFLKSAYKHISKKIAHLINTQIYDEMLQRYHNKENVFRWVVDQYNHLVPHVTNDWLLKEYREHIPEIVLSNDIKAFLSRIEELKIPAGLITDGRSITQRNKLKALGIENFFKEIIVSEEFGSEKPDKRNYLIFEEKFPEKNFYFFGDNLKKDFIVPLQLGWQAICIKDSGNNIHKQEFNVNHVPMPIIISSLSDIILC